MLKGIGSQVKYLRKARGLTQEQLAERANLSLTCISRLENERAMVSLDTLLNISEILGTDLGILLSDYIRSNTTSKQETQLLADYRKLTTLDKKRISEIIRIMAQNTTV